MTLTPCAPALPRLKHARGQQWATTMRVVVTRPDALDQATAMLPEQLGCVQDAASRFRADSELCRIARCDADEHVISPLLTELVGAVLTAAATSGGRVDPTIGTVIAGLDRPDVPGIAVSTVRPVTWRDVDLQDQTLVMPALALLDLGATGKAFAADRAAQSIAEALGCGVLVSLGGDVRVAGPDPEHGWAVLVQDRQDQPASLIDLRGARAIATSSCTLHRRIGPERAHHIVDPLTLAPITPVWRTVSAAATYVAANTWSTAAIIEGPGAPGILADTGLPAPLVGSEGRVLRLGGWPA